MNALICRIAHAVNSMDADPSRKETVRSWGRVLKELCAIIPPKSKDPHEQFDITVADYSTVNEITFFVKTRSMGLSGGDYVGNPTIKVVASASLLNLLDLKITDNDPPNLELQDDIYHDNIELLVEYVWDVMDRALIKDVSPTVWRELVLWAFK